MRTFFHKLRGIPSPLPLIFIITTTVLLILYGRGYRPDFTKNPQLKPTGLLSTTSDPVGSQVYVNGELKTATDNTINLDPGWYTIKIAKEGFIPWQKELRLQGEVVTRTDAFLFPTSPSLSPITTVGIEKPLLSPDGTKIAYIIPKSDDTVTKKAGLWVYELVEHPLGFNRDPKQLGTFEPLFNFSNSNIVWSPDSQQILVDAGSSVRLYTTSKANDFQDISANSTFILVDWQEERILKEKQKLAAFKQPVINTATSSAKIIAFSPDETKFLYEATASAVMPSVLIPPLIGTNPTEEKRKIEPGKLYVYDSREDKNYFVLDKKELEQLTPSPTASPKNKSVLPSPSPSQLATGYKLPSNIYWFPTNRHLVLTLPGKIDIMEYDRTNWVTVYSGPFIDGFIAPWPNGSRIIVLTNLNPGVARLPNLYTVNLR